MLNKKFYDYKDSKYLKTSSGFSESKIAEPEISLFAPADTRVCAVSSDTPISIAIIRSG